MSSEIVKAAPRDPVALGQVLSQSGYFADAKQAAQAAVKVMAGEEVGLGPVASMTGIHIVQGKVTLGANIIAALVRRHPDYDYEVTEHTDQVCTIRFTYKGKPAGTSSFSMEDAAKAGLTKNPTWKAHPRNMLFARAMSNGAKWYAPDVSAGAPLYTPDELGAEVDGETLEVVSLPPQDVRPEPVPDPVARVDEIVDATTGEVMEDAPFDGKQAYLDLVAEYGEAEVKQAFVSLGIKGTGSITPAAVAEAKAMLGFGGEREAAA